MLELKFLKMAHHPFKKKLPDFVKMGFHQIEISNPRSGLFRQNGYVQYIWTQ